jgi:hypothetical protein
METGTSMELESVMLEGGAAATEEATRESLALSRHPEQIIIESLQFTCPLTANTAVQIRC